jgi:hypothetical protein
MSQCDHATLGDCEMNGCLVERQDLDVDLVKRAARMRPPGLMGLFHMADGTDPAAIAAEESDQAGPEEADDVAAKLAAVRRAEVSFAMVDGQCVELDHRLRDSQRERNRLAQAVRDARRALLVAVAGPEPTRLSNF